MLKKLLTHLGNALALLGIIFVAIKFFHNGHQLDFSELNINQWSTLVVMAIIYGLANFLLAFAWWNILTNFDVNISLIFSLNSYGIAQLAKYIPGNIFQFVSRQAMGLSENIPGKLLLKSMMWEMSLLVVSAAIFGFLVIPLLFFKLNLTQSFLIFIIIFILLLFIFYHWNSHRITLAFILQFFFMAFSGILFVEALVLISGAKPFSVCVTMFGCYIIAWLVGFLIPGAPAGLGIRETVLLFFLKAVVTKSMLLLAVILARGVTISGDFLFFLVCLWLRNKANWSFLTER